MKANYQEKEKYTFNEHEKKLINIGLKMAQMLESTGIRIKTKTMFYMFKKWWCGRYKIFKLHFRNENSNILGRTSDTPKKKTFKMKKRNSQSSNKRKDNDPHCPAAWFLHESPKRGSEKIT